MEYHDVYEEHLKLLQPKAYGEDNSLLERIGINWFPIDLPRGYLRRLKEDFIVEEIHRDESLSTIETTATIGQVPAKTDAKEKTLWLDIVKAGISTLDVADILAKNLKIEVFNVGYAGLKDDEAITSQQFALRQFPPNISEFPKHPHFFAKNIKWGKDILKKGYLKGNRFIILVRTEKEVAPHLIEQKLQDLKTNGFFNFYGEQRFGTPRFLNPALGAMILRQNYTAAIKTFLVGSSPWEPEDLSKIRLVASRQYAAWPNMLEIFSRFPYPFRYELKAIKHLTKNPKDIIGALQSIEEIVQIWIYAYASFAFNYKLSQIAQQKQEHLFPTLPLVTSPDSQDTSLYKNILEKHQIKDYKKALAPFQKIKLVSRNIPTKIEAEILNFKITPQGVVLAFSLPKGAYATVFLRNIFQLLQGQPVPPWVNDEYVDVKQILDLGSVTDTKNYFSK